MADENVLERIVALIKKLASLPEARIQKAFESVEDEELAAYSEIADQGIARADRTLGVTSDEPPDATK